MRGWNLGHKKSKGFAWFERGADAIQRIASIDMEGRYVCPLCIRAFDRDNCDAELTREHAPPQSVGGRKVALTCRDCNSIAGSLLDSHVAKHDNFERGWTARPLTSKITIGDVTAKIDVSVRPGEINLTDFRRRNSPTTSDALARALGAAAGKQVRLEFALNHDSRLVEIGWLRAAYIVAFAVFGYSYILQPSLDAVRCQIQDPEALIIEECYHGTSAEDGPSTRRIGVTRDVHDLDVVVVQIGKHVWFLPGFSPDIDVYAELSTMKNSSLDFTLNEYRWPTEPQHQLDFEEPRPYYPRLELRSRPPVGAKL